MNRMLCQAVIKAATLVALSFTMMAPSVQAATPKDMFVMATSLEAFTTLDPGESFEMGPGEYFRNVYDRLVQVDLHNPAHFNDSIAQSWTVSPDQRTFSFKLRSDLRFHSGNPLTADDVVWSIQPPCSSTKDRLRCSTRLV